MIKGDLSRLLTVRILCEILLANNMDDSVPPFRLCERRVLSLAKVGLPEVPIFGHYVYSSAKPGLEEHCHPGVFEICYLVRGTQTYRAGGRHWRLSGGDIFFTRPGDLHDTGGEPENRGSLYWFNLRLPQPGAKWLGIPPPDWQAIALQLARLSLYQFKGSQTIKECFEHIFVTFDSRAFPLRNLAVANEMVRLCLEVLQCAQDQKVALRSPRIQQIVARIDLHPEEEYSLDDLAQQAGLSLSRFKARFKDEIGIPPHEYILDAKIEAAKKHLLTRSLTVTDIAMQLGFNSSQYFATVFKQFTKQSPREFAQLGAQVSLRPGRLQPKLQAE